MSSGYLKYDDSGHCDFAQIHQFVSICDNDGKVGIYCVHCGYILFEHSGNMYLTPGAELIEMIDQSSEVGWTG